MSQYILIIIMGFYYGTYLCSGKFNDKGNVVIDKKIQVASMDNIIENHEWTNEYVKKSDVVTFLSNNHADKNIDLIESDTNDLFFEEACSCTMTMPVSNSSKYILIEKNCSYTN